MLALEQYPITVDLQSRSLGSELIMTASGSWSGTYGFRGCLNARLDNIKVAQDSEERLQAASGFSESGGALSRAMAPYIWYSPRIDIAALSLACCVGFSTISYYVT